MRTLYLVPDVTSRLDNRIVFAAKKREASALAGDLKRVEFYNKLIDKWIRRKVQLGHRSHT